MTDQLPAHLPAHLANRQRRAMLQEAVGGINRSRGPHVSIADNRFVLVDGSGNEKPIQTLYVDLVIVDVNPHVSRQYYDPSKPFSKDGGEAPICFSDNGVGASAQAAQPQNVSCQLCPKSAWNSAVSKMTGKGIPACAQRKKLAAIAGGMGEMVFDLTVPPASLKNWLAYCNILAQRGLEPYDVYTRVEFESQGVLKFSPAPIGDKGLCYVHEGVVALTEKLWAAKATDEATNKNDVPWGGQGEAQKIAYANQQTQQIAPQMGRQEIQAPPQPFGGGQPAADPFGGPATQSFGATSAEPSSAFAGQPNVQTANNASEAPRTRKPRTPKETAPADDGIPPFLRRTAESAPAAAPAPNPTQFGMQAAPPAPDAGIQAALDAAFRLPT